MAELPHPASHALTILPRRRTKRRSARNLGRCLLESLAAVRAGGSVLLVATPAAELTSEVNDLTRQLIEVASDALIGVYVHGSAVLGDFLPGQSDLDVLVVVRDGTDEAVIAPITATLAADRPSTAIGIEASTVDAADASRARPPWRFRSHVTTAPTNRKVVSGIGHPGDPDLALHYLVARHAGWAAKGPDPVRVFGRLDRRIVFEHLAAELRWAATEAPTTYAVLNACRALRFGEDSTICSKTEGGRWALERGIRAEVVAAALAHRSGNGQAPSDEARAWVASVAELLS